jgi:gamma-glutamylcyclotransferase (GGCT)/AIG2-like uncharacterized protein YtfP
MRPDLPLRVFVYGTLKPSGGGYQQFLQQCQVEAIPAMARGQLYHLPAGYPAMTVGKEWVQGALLSIYDQGILARLDAYEDYHPERSAAENLYYRTEIEVFAPDSPTAPTSLGHAWVYLMEPVWVQDLEGHRVETGHWELETI